jgi:hypothetical protein
MTKLRILIVVLTLVASVGAAYRYAILPYRANLAKRQLNLSTATARQTPHAMSSAALARENVSTARFWIARIPEDVALRVPLMVNLMLLKRHDEAERAALEALRYEIRPELLFNLALSQLELGKASQAVENFSSALRIDPWLLSEIPLAVRSSVYESAVARQQYCWNYARNSEFSTAAHVEGISAAHRWRIWHESAGVRTALRRSTRSRGSMLEVRTENAREGVYQVWFRPGVPPAQVVTQAWLFVESGRVGIHSGSGLAAIPDAIVDQAGKWVQISVTSTSCPASRTYVISLDGPAHFYLDEVDVRATDVTACQSL